MNFLAVFFGAKVMADKKDSDHSGKDFCREFSHSLFSSGNIVTVYTILSVLLKMRKDLGLEAMLGYIEKYLITIEGHNPGMKKAVATALKFINVKKIYEDAMGK